MLIQQPWIPALLWLTMDMLVLGNLNYYYVVSIF